MCARRRRTGHVYHLASRASSSPRRVLGFNLRLPLLKSSLPLEEKRTWLTDEIQHKVSEHKVRYYQEPTFIFDD